MLTFAATIAVSSPVGCAAPRPVRNPEQSQVQYQLSVDCYRGRRVEAALEELAKSLAADPDNHDAHNLWGIIALNQGSDYLAQAETIACLKGNDDATVRAEAVRKFREAQLHFRKATEIKNDFSAAWNNLAVASLQLREWEEAMKSAQNALRDITYAEPQVARANLGWAYFQKKEVHNAWKELHESVARTPGFCVGRFRLARVYVERGDLDQAADEVESVTANKQCPIQEAFLLAGIVAKRRQKNDSARAFFQQCVDMAPRSCVANECKGYGEMIQ